MSVYGSHPTRLQQCQAFLLQEMFFPDSLSLPPPITLLSTSEMFSLLLFFTLLLHFVSVYFRFVYSFTFLGFPVCSLFNILVVTLVCSNVVDYSPCVGDAAGPILYRPIFHGPNVQLRVSQKQILQLHRSYTVSCRFQIGLGFFSLLSWYL